MKNRKSKKIGREERRSEREARERWFPRVRQPRGEEDDSFERAFEQDADETVFPDSVQDPVPRSA